MCDILFLHRYDAFGAILSIDLISSSPPPTQIRTTVKLFVLKREDYEAYLRTAGSPPAFDPDSSKCLNPNCNVVRMDDLIQPSRTIYCV